MSSASIGRILSNMFLQSKFILAMSEYLMICNKMYHKKKYELRPLEADKNLSFIDKHFIKLYIKVTIPPVVKQWICSKEDFKP